LVQLEQLEQLELGQLLRQRDQLVLLEEQEEMEELHLLVHSWLFKVVAVELEEQLVDLLQLVSVELLVWVILE
jgi:hypothetical protein